MPDLEKIEAEIRAGLEGVSKGPWTHYSAPLRPGMNGINEVQCSERAPVVAWMGFDDSFRSKAKHKRNAAHIARCDPDTIRLLLDELSRLREALDEAHADIERMTPKYVAYEYLESPAGREIAEARVAVLEKALEPFAREADAISQGHLDGHVTDLDTTHVSVGHLRAARRALQEGGE